MIEIDGLGHIALLDTMPDRHRPTPDGAPLDLAVVQAARVSFDAGSKGPEADKKLIGYLLRNGHGTPFEHALFKFRVHLPIFLERQWLKHRVGAFSGQGGFEVGGHSQNSVSHRYVAAEDEFYIPQVFRKQAAKNKQGSEGELDSSVTGELQNYWDALLESAWKTYEFLLERGVAREQARTILPLGTYTSFVWTVNARALMHWLDLRGDAHAQAEIRAYAEAVEGVFAAHMPWTHAAWKEASRG